MAKRYYWLKLKDDFFNNKLIKKLRKIAGGDTYTIIYLKMQLLSLKESGVIKFEGTEKTLAEQLALELDEDEDNVKITLSFLASNNLMEQCDDEYLLPQAAESIGSEAESTARVRKLREKNKQKALQCNAGVTECNTDVRNCNQNATLEIRDKREEIDKDIYNPPISPQGESDDVHENLTVAEKGVKKAGADKQVSTTAIIQKRFDEFWAAYPKKVEKKKARKIYLALKPDEALHAKILAAIEAQKKTRQWQEGYIKNPTGWLNAERWNDEVTATEPNKPKKQTKFNNFGSGKEQDLDAIIRRKQGG